MDARDDPAAGRIESEERRRFRRGPGHVPDDLQRNHRRESRADRDGQPAAASGAAPRAAAIVASRAAAVSGSRGGGSSTSIDRSLQTRHGPSTPFSSRVPSSSKVALDPTTRSLVVPVVKTSAAPASAMIRAAIWTAMPLTLPSTSSHSPGVDTRADVEAELLDGRRDRDRAAQSLHRLGERGEKPVAGRVLLVTVVALQLAPNELAKAAEHGAPAGRRRACSRSRSSQRCPERAPSQVADASASRACHGKSPPSEGRKQLGRRIRTPLTTVAEPPGRVTNPYGACRPRWRCEIEVATSSRDRRRSDVAQPRVHRAGAAAAEEELEGLAAQVAELTRRVDDFEALLRRSQDA